MKEGRKEGRKEGKEGKKEGRMEGRKDGRKDGRKGVCCVFVHCVLVYIKSSLLTPLISSRGTYSKFYI